LEKEVMLLAEARGGRASRSLRGAFR